MSNKSKKLDSIAKYNERKNAVKSAFNFQEQITAWQAKLLTRSVDSDERVKRALKKAQRVLKALIVIQAMKETPAADFRKAAIHFHESGIADITPEIYAKWNQKSLDKSLALCTNDKQREVVLEWYELKAERDLQDVELMRLRIEKYGFSFTKDGVSHVSDKKEEKKKEEVKEEVAK